MEQSFSANCANHGLTVESIDYSIFLNWTYSSAGNVSTGSGPESPQPTLSHLGIITATLLGLLLGSHGTWNKHKHIIKYQSIFQWILIIIFLLLSIPVISLLAVYRCLVFCILKLKTPTFISLMDGPDAVWNLKDSSRPIIVVLALVEAEEPQALLEDIRETLLKAVSLNPKLSWKRKYSSLGFSYWETCNDLSSLKENVRWMQNKLSDDHISKDVLRHLLSDIASNGILKEDSCWEILVSRQKLIGDDVPENIYPVAFTIHHSLGDGVSLLELLLSSLSIPHMKRHNSSCNFFGETISREAIVQNEEKEQKNLELHNNTVGLKHAKVGSINNADKETSQNQIPKQTLKTFINLNYPKNGAGPVERIMKFSSNIIILHYTFRMVLEKLFNSITCLGTIKNQLFDNIYMILSSIQKIREACEWSILDSRAISGEKLITWYSDSCQGHLFSSIKCIKSHVKGIRFTDVVLTALSASIEKFIARRGAYVPRGVSVVVPVYSHYKAGNVTESFHKQKTFPFPCKDTSLNSSSVEEPTKKIVQLNNSFSLGIMRLPIKMEGKISSEHLRTVARHTEFMHRSGQFELNSFILDWVANLVPGPLLNCLLHFSGHNTLVISNLAGPEDISFLAGYSLRNIFFWVPHKGTTGLSISILSYCKQIQLGVMADRAVISSFKEVESILNETLTTVKVLDDLFTKPINEQSYKRKGQESD